MVTLPPWRGSISNSPPGVLPENYRSLAGWDFWGHSQVIDYSGATQEVETAKTRRRWSRPKPIPTHPTANRPGKPSPSVPSRPRCLPCSSKASLSSLEIRTAGHERLRGCAMLYVPLRPPRLSGSRARFCTGFLNQPLRHLKVATRAFPCHLVEDFLDLNPVGRLEIRWISF